VLRAQILASKEKINFDARAVIKKTLPMLMSDAF
jgi:hypothetical protein